MKRTSLLLLLTSSLLALTTACTDAADDGDDGGGPDSGGGSGEGGGGGEGTGGDGGTPIEPATHFASDFTQFTVPLGGTAERGFWALSGSPDDLGDDQWSLLDIDGDGLADLVRTASLISNGGSWETRAFSDASGPFWSVHLNNGQGFAAEGMRWSLPGGGLALRSYPTLGGGPNDLGDEAWSVVDIDGDGLVDLVRTASLVSDAGDWQVKAFSDASGSYWSVHLNTGSGFSADGVRWDLPAGGTAERSYHNLSGSPDDLGDDNWTLADLDGDGMPDLVRTAQLIAVQGNWMTKAFSDGGGSFWSVHFNTGTRFAAEGARWSLPTGGTAERSYHNIAGSPDDLGDDVWSMVDLDGDGKPDLVRTAQMIAVQGNWMTKAFSDASGSFWSVHTNDGMGFAPDGARWGLPAGGTAERSYHSLSGAPDDLGDDNWSLVDLEGDGKPDLVRTASLIAVSGDWRVKAFSDESGGFWAVHKNDGAGFAADGARWGLPTGGTAERGFHGLAGSPDDLGDDMWSVVELNGDGRPDLVITSRLVEDGGQWIQRVDGHQVAPTWRVALGTP